MLDGEQLTIGYGGEATECNKCEKTSDEVVTIEVRGVVFFVCKDCLVEAVNDAINDDDDTKISVS